jgi:hypothetical protein
MQPERLDTFMAAWQQSLTSAVATHPEEYCYRVAEVPAVIAKLRASLESKPPVKYLPVNHDGRGCRGACKIVGIKHTVKAIIGYLNGTSA